LCHKKSPPDFIAFSPTRRFRTTLFQHPQTITPTIQWAIEAHQTSSWTAQSILQSEPARMPLRGGPQTMANVSSIIAPLRRERDRVERQLTGLNAALTAFAGVYGGKSSLGRERRKM